MSTANALRFFPVLLLCACANTTKQSGAGTDADASVQKAVPVIVAEKNVVFAAWTPELAHCQSPLDQSVQHFAKKLPPNRKLVDVSTFFDFVLPESADAARRMNFMALLSVRVFGSALGELPMEKIYWSPEKDRSKVFMLPPIFPRLPIFKIDEESGARLGKYRNDGFFFFPLNLLKEEGGIWVVLKGGSKPLRVAQLPLPAKGREVLKKIKKLEAPSAEKIPDPDFIVPMLLKRYCWIS